MPTKLANNKMTEAQALKIPPHSIEAEQAVLGGLMIDSKAWDRIADKVTIEDYYRHSHRILFQVMAQLALKNIPFDVLTIAESLKAINELEACGGEVYLFELANNTPSAANIAAYADIVRERSILRQLIGVGNDIADLGFAPEGRTPQELLDQAEQKVFKIAEQGARTSQPIRITQLLTLATEKIDALYHADEAITGVPTGFMDFDDKTSGLHKGDLIIVAGRPSMGKTTFAMNIVENAAMRIKKPVVVFSMEMPGEQLAMRMISSLGRIDQHHVRTGKLHDDDWPRLTMAVSMLSEAPLFIDDTPALTPSEIRSRARRIAREHGDIGLIMIDYLQLMHIPGHKENRNLEISEISRNLKALAKELHVPVIALSQLNRSLEQRQNKRPMMADLRESGSLEQDADLIAFIYRDEVYNEESPEKGIAEIIIGKQRNGPIGTVRLTFLGQFTRFENLSTGYGFSPDIE